MRKKVLAAACSVLLLGAVSAVAASPTDADNNTQMKETSSHKKKSKKKASTQVSETPAIKKPMWQLGPHIGASQDSRIKIDGFMSVGVSETTASPSASSLDYEKGYVVPEHGVVKNHLSFAPNTLVGLQFTARIMDNLDAVAQLVADGSNVNGSRAYEVEAEWVFLRYKLNDNFQFRLGRMRLPLFMYSDTQEVGYTYPWVFLPQTVYRVVPFNNFNGVDVVYTRPIGDGDVVLRVQPFYGQNHSKYDMVTVGAVNGYPGLPSTDGTGVVVPLGDEADFDETGLVGGMISLGNDDFTLRLSYAHVNLSADVELYSLLGGGLNDLGTRRAISEDKGNFYGASARYAFGLPSMKIPGRFVLEGEFAYRKAQQGIADLQGYYVMAGYKTGRWFPNLTYGQIRTTNSQYLSGAQEAPQAERDWTLGTAYTVSNNVIVKVSGTQIKPKKGTWGLYNFKPQDKRSYLWAASVDVVF